MSALSGVVSACLLLRICWPSERREPVQARYPSARWGRSFGIGANSGEALVDEVPRRLPDAEILALRVLLESILLGGREPYNDRGIARRPFGSFVNFCNHPMSPT